MTDYNPVDYSPNIPDFPTVNPFLPCYGKFDLTTYIQGASDYEIMANLVQLYNTMAKGYNNVQKLSTDTANAYNQLQDFINDVFAQPDLNKTLQNVLTNMFENGTMQKYLEPLLSYATPEMYGAKGDGLTDDTTALTNMFNSGATSFKLTNGKTYRITKSISVTANTIDGQNACILADNCDALIYSTFKYNRTICNLIIKSTADHFQSSYTALTFSGAHAFLYNIAIYDFGTGIKYDETLTTGNQTGNIFNNIHIRYCHTGLDIGNDRNNKSTDYTITNCTFACDTYGVRAGSTIGYLISNIHTWGRPVSAFYLIDCSNTSLTNLYIEECSNGIYANSLQGFNISNVTFVSSVATTFLTTYGQHYTVNISNLNIRYHDNDKGILLIDGNNTSRTFNITNSNINSETVLTNKTSYTVHYSVIQKITNTLSSINGSNFITDVLTYDTNIGTPLVFELTGSRVSRPSAFLISVGYGSTNTVNASLYLLTLYTSQTGVTANRLTTIAENNTTISTDNSDTNLKVTVTCSASITGHFITTVIPL